MAHPLVWPKKAFFYPIGNTPPICLTQELSPEEDADILLLGCGDPRSILFTIFSDLAPGKVVHSFIILVDLHRVFKDYRKLDITCCDWEPAVIARNVILLTMAADGVPTIAAWSIFYDLFLGKAPYDILLAQCRTLIQASSDMKTWKTSKYGDYIRFSTNHTLSEVRRHWTLYLDFETLSNAEKKSVRSSFTSGMKAIKGQFGGDLNMTGMRSAGPLFFSYMKNASKSFDSFWSTGTTTPVQQGVSSTLYTNPTFLYSLSGKVFNVHYGTDPLLAFHIAPALVSIKGEKANSNFSLTYFIGVARNQFQLWCSAFQKRVSKGPEANLKVRFHVGESLAFCHALLLRQRKGIKKGGVYTAPWGGSQIILDDQDYSQDKNSAPLSFNIIDTSNLTDHLGIINLLSATVPLLQSKPWATIHTNTLVTIDPDDPSTSTLASRAGMDIPTLSLLFGVTPSSHLCHFTTESNKHELPAVTLGSKQGHDYISWKRPVSTIPAYIPKKGSAITPLQVWNAKDLGRIFFSLYLLMFENEGMHSMTTSGNNFSLWQKALKTSYTRESLVMLFAVVKERIDVDLEEVMDAFLGFVEADRTLMIGTNNYQDLICQLFQRDLYVMDTLKTSFLKALRNPKDLFQGWKDVPPAVCVVLKVPRIRLKVLEDMTADEILTPFLHCETRGRSSGFQFPPFHNIHSSIRPIFGQILTSTVGGETEVSIEEDLRGFGGDSPLIVSFYMPTWILLKYPSDSVEVGLGFKITPSALMKLVPKLGLNLNIYSTKVSNSTNVYIVRHRPDNHQELERLRNVPVLHEVMPKIENSSKVTVNIDPSGRKATSLTLRAEITDMTAKQRLGSGASVTTKSVADSTVNLKFQDYDHDLVFPFPIYGDRTKVRIARKSSYVEVEAPIRPDFEDSRILSLSPFPIAISEKNVHLLNIHYLNLDKLPTLALPKSENNENWVSVHMGLSMSEGEKAAKESPDQKLRGPIPNLKESIATIFMHYMNMAQRPRVFGLSDKLGLGIYTLIFLNDIKLDLSAHTIVVDACVVPLYDDMVSKVANGLAKLRPIEIYTLEDEVSLWKMLLPAAAERCRTWKHTSSCEYLEKGVPAVLDGYTSSPLCSCGKGKNLGAFATVPEWKPFYQEATRIALGPLFTFSLQTKLISSMKAKQGSLGNAKAAASTSKNVSTPSNASTCANCGGPGNPVLQTCSNCKNTQYCSRVCQKSHWKAHKALCTAK